MRRSLAALASAALLLMVLGAGSDTETSTDDLGSVADFALTERGGRTIHRAEFEGKVWVAGFIFTHCNQSCPRITASMAQLQRDFAGNHDLVLVSFSVDPERDTPERLQAYASSYQANPQRWLFLTGNQEAVYQLIRGSFHLGVEQKTGENRVPGDEVLHSNKLVLVDRRGRIRGYFEGTDPEELAQLRRKIAVLISPFPLANATLNGLSGILLILGYTAIKARRVRLHKIMMLTALGVSAVFLASYLYYHLAICGGEPTRFEGTGWVRSIYFAVLLSHTLLAAAVAPLALVTAYQGLRDRLARHVWLARWTLPIWLYVSITGVVVYWMLYRLYSS
jgi:protein SCO1/2/putative membrane protein